MQKRQIYIETSDNNIDLNNFENMNLIKRNQNDNVDKCKYLFLTNYFFSF